MRQVIKIALKVGPNTYSGKRGAPKRLIEVRPAPNTYTGPVVVMEIDPTIVAPDCSFTVATFNEKVDETVAGDMVGHVGDYFVYSPCFTQAFLSKVKELNQR